MNLTRQVHLRLIERAATRLRIMDALTKINAHKFAFGHHDSDADGAARAGANKLLGVLPWPRARDRIAGVLHQMTARPA